MQHEAQRHIMEQTHYMDFVLFCCFFSWLDTERLSRRAVITKSRQYAVSLCGVTFRDTLCAPRASFPQNISSQPMRCMSQTLQATCFAPIPKRSSDLNSVRAQQTFVAKVTVCRHVVSNRHSFPVKTIALYSSYTVGSQKHQACSSRIFSVFLFDFLFSQLQQSLFIAYGPDWV